MKEKIIFAPGCNETELVRTLAKFGKNTLGLRIVNSVELSRMALLASGLTLKQTFVTRKQEAPLVDSFIRTVDYFKNSTFSDSQNMSNVLFSMRSLIVENEKAVLHSQLLQGEFKEKNQAIIDVYDKYCKKLTDLKCIDTIALIRSAIEKAKPIFAQFSVLSEYPLSPIETELLRIVSDNNYRTTSISEMCGQESVRSQQKITEAYGISNEVSNILSFIFKNNLPLDQCTIAITDTNRYGQMIYDLSAEYDFNVSFGVGLPIQNSNPARVLKEYSYWNGEANHSAEALNHLVYNDAFNRELLKKQLGIAGENNKALHSVIDYAGNLRLSTDRKNNDEKLKKFEAAYRNEDKEQVLKSVKALAGILEKPCSEIVSSYSKMRFGYSGRIDKSATKVITDFLENYFKYSESTTADNVIDDILNLTVCSEGSKEGALFVTNITGALSSIRKYLFVAGLSYDFFPGSPKENYMVLDSDYLLLPNNGSAPTSENIIQNKIKSYNDLLNTASALGVSVHLSYSDFDLAGLKEKNMSSVLKSDSAVTVGYFDDELSPLRNIGRKIKAGALFYENDNNNGNDAIGNSTEVPAEIDYLAKEYSPSAIETFFECPRRFFYKSIIGLKEPEEVKPYEVISAKDVGLLFHSVMEYFANKKISKPELLSFSENQFDGYLELHTPLSRDGAEREKGEFLGLIANGYDIDSKNEVITAENELKATHGTGIKLKGIPDRIEVVPGGEKIIADYKTGYRINHKENDVDSCLQALIYAFLAESNGIADVSGCEFRYPRLKKIIKCSYSDDMKEKLSEKLSEFKAGLEDGIFPCVEKSKRKDSCKYCKFGNMCGKDKDAE